MGDLDTLDSDEVLEELLEERRLNDLVKFQTCFKSNENPSAIDLMITNKGQHFQHTTSISIVLSIFRK